MLLPYVELATVYDTLNVARSTPMTAMLNNRATMQQTNSVFLCPSDAGAPQYFDTATFEGCGLQNDPSETNYGLPVTNYIVSNNIAGVRARPASDNVTGTLGAVGAFYGNSKVSFRDITDGTSNTLLVGERSYQLGTNQIAAGVFLAVRDHNGGGPANWQHGAATAYLTEGLKNIVGSSIYPINSTGATYNSERGLIYASQHQGGAQFLMADGGVRFLSENIHLHNQYVGAGSWVVASTFERLIAIADGQVIGEF